MIHKKFAQIYDEFMDFVDYNSWYKFLASFVKKKNNLKVLDLGCGTGKLAHLFAKNGHQVIGVDISSDMIEISKSKYNLENLEFKVGDITKEKFGEDFDFIMCNFDTVNYFNDLKSLISFLDLAYSSLKDKGLLVFDFVEEGIFDEMFENDLFVDETDKYTCIMHHKKKSKFKHLVEMTIFAKEDDVYRKYSETHEKNIYDTDKLLELVRNAGFEIYDSARNSEYGESRIFLICRK